MTDKKDEIYSKALRAGRRTYFFDVRSTRADDYYLTITESKREFNEDGSIYYKKHKVYLYKEDFKNFKEHLDEITKYIIKERGEDIISLQKEDEKSEKEEKNQEEETNQEEILEKDDDKENNTTNFTEVNFEDLGKDDQ